MEIQSEKALTRGLCNCVAFAAVFLASVNNLVEAQSSDAISKRFLDEAPHAWREYQAFSENLQGSVSFQVITDGKEDSTGRVEVRNNLNCKVYLVQRLNRQLPKGRLNGSNPQYEFSLVRPDDKHAWVLETIRLAGRKGPISTTWKEEATQALQPLLVVGAVTLPELLRHPSFRILRAAPIQQGGRELVRMEFDNSHPVTDEKSYMLLQGGTMILDPDHSWTLREFTVHHSYREAEATINGVLEPRDPSDKRPIPKRLESRTEIVYQKTGVRATMLVVNDFDLYSPSALPPDSDFYLSAFGLPEPMGVRAPAAPPRWNLWIGLAGLGMLAAGVLLRQYLKRPNRALASLGKK